ncbi:MAG: GTP pyrophosphokinase [Clostridia bacterium]|nr:GTP pyrophosphokinase [Clostridia bacterium]
MYYSPLVKKAAMIAFDAHKDDVDKGGYPYVMHPFYLAFRMDDEDSVCVALLHDVVEDHGDKYPMSFLEKEFGETVITALKLLTHDPAVPYMDYVREIGKNEVTRKVKIADLMHNSDASRLDGKKSKKYELYQEALAYLTGLQGK